MGRLASPEEILRASSTSIDDHALGLQFPACDWAGYFLFAALAGDGPCQAVNIGLLIGHMEGRDLRMPSMVGDPRKLVVIRSLVYDGVSYRSPDDSSYTRADLVYARTGLDVQVADVARIRGRWPEFELYFVDRAHDVVYDLAGRAGHVHWLPDHVYSNLYSYVVFPDFAFEGTIAFKGVLHEVSGVGGLDHVNGRNVASPTSPGVGFWQYDPISWDGGWTSSALLFLGGSGEVVVGAGAVTAPGGGYHPCTHFAIEYVDVDEGGANSGIGEERQSVPRAWRGLLRGDGCELAYAASRIDVAAPDGRRIVEANALFEAQGVLRLRGRTERSIRGRGYNEFMGGGIDLASLARTEEGR